MGAFASDAVSSADWSRDQLQNLFARADWMTRQPRHALMEIAPKLVTGLLFYQNSTRTRISFQTASSLLGGRYVGFDDATTTRAGDFFAETLEDTVKVMACYADVLVLRHVDDDAAQRARSVSPVPVISAGTGESDHPTQGMLDTWMMLRSLGDLTGRRIGLYGDPGCRAIRAIVTVAAKFDPAEFVFLTPEGADVPPEMGRQLGERGIGARKVGDVAELVRRVDLVSMIPFELPDFHLSSAPQQQRVGGLADRYQVGRPLLEGPGRDVVVLHTGPRGEELPAEVDDLPNVRYFDGVRSGVFLRAALLSALTDVAQPPPALEMEAQAR